jgi:enoyl-CoA hydratase/carnithine racemase
VGYQTLNFEVSAGVATITLNRPNNMNAMSPQMGAELHEVALEIDADQDIRAVVLTGAGKVFCAGGDLGEFAAGR